MYVGMEKIVVVTRNAALFLHIKILIKCSRIMQILWI